jgi:hypothetical protein
MSAQDDPMVMANDWSKIPTTNKWWFQAVLTFLVVPLGLVFVLFVPAYQKRKGKVERIGKGTKSIIVALAIVLVGLSLTRWAGTASSDDLEVMDRGAVLIIKNLGAGPIEIREVVINDRPECTTSRPAQVLKVGEMTGWPSQCFSKARATIKTDRGDLTYTFGRQ